MRPRDNWEGSRPRPEFTGRTGESGTPRSSSISLCKHLSRRHCNPHFYLDALGQSRVVVQLFFKRLWRFLGVTAFAVEPKHQPTISAGAAVVFIRKVSAGKARHTPGGNKWNSRVQTWQSDPCRTSGTRGPERQPTGSPPHPRLQGRRLWQACYARLLHA